MSVLLADASPERNGNHLPFWGHRQFVKAVSDSVKFHTGYLHQFNPGPQKQKMREFKENLAGCLRPFLDQFVDAGDQAVETGNYKLARDKYVVAEMISETWARSLCRDEMRRMVQDKLNDVKEHLNPHHRVLGVVPLLDDADPPRLEGLRFRRA